MKKYLIFLLIPAIFCLFVLSITKNPKNTFNYLPQKGLVYINVWEEWCGPCKEELPELQKIHNKYANQVKFYLFSDSKNTDQAKAFLRKLNIHGFEEIYDTQKTLDASSVFNSLDMNTVPKHLIIKDGNVIYNKTGSGAVVISEITQVIEANK